MSPALACCIPNLHPDGIFGVTLSAQAPDTQHSKLASSTSSSKIALTKRSVSPEARFACWAAGAGKTLIAVMLINELMDRLVNNAGLNKKVAVFLAPKVDLVVQVTPPALVPHHIHSAELRLPGMRAHAGLDAQQL